MKLINAESLKSWIKRRCNPYGKPDLDFNTSKEIMTMIDRMDNSDKWIPAEERLPEEDGMYLVTFKNGIKVCMIGYGSCERTVLGYPIGHGWYSLEEAQYYAEDSISAWMPLPEPYKEGRI